MKTLILTDTNAVGILTATPNPVFSSVGGISKSRRLIANHQLPTIIHNPTTLALKIYCQNICTPKNSVDLFAE